MFDIKLSRFLELVYLVLSGLAPLALLIYLNVRLGQTWSSSAAAFPVMVPWGFLLLALLLFWLGHAIKAWLPASRAVAPAMAAGGFSLLCLLMTLGYSHLEQNEGHTPHVGGMVIADILAGCVTVLCCLTVWTIPLKRKPATSA